MIETKKLIEIADVIDSLHQTPEYVEEGIPMVRVTDVKPGDLLLDGCQFVTEDVFEKFTANHVPHKGDIVISRVGTYGNFAYVADDIKFCLGQNTSIIAPRINSRYLYYFLQSPFTRRQIESRVVGSTQKTLSLKNIKELEVPCPDEVTQKKIANVLETIDLKIANNNRINRNLEQQIETHLMCSLEADGAIPSKLGEYLYIKGRIGWKGLKKSEYLEYSDYRIINGESLTPSGIDWNKAGYISAERYEESPEIMLQVGDILLSKDGTIGKIGYVDKLESPTSVASGIFVIRNTRQDIISTQFIYYLLKSKLFRAFIENRTEGSVIPHLYQKDFMEFEFPLPRLEQMKKFDNVTASMFSNVFLNLSENRSLSRLRDRLLPRLMSGEVDVSSIEI